MEEDTSPDWTDVIDDNGSGSLGVAIDLPQSTIALDNNIETTSQPAGTVGGSFQGQVTVGTSSNGGVSILLDGDNRRIVLMNGNVPAISMDQYGLYFGQTPPNSQSPFWVSLLGDVIANGLNLTGFLTNTGVGQIVSGSIIAGSPTGANITIDGSVGSITFQASTGELAGSIYGQIYSGVPIIFLNADIVTGNVHTEDLIGDAQVFPGSISGYNDITVLDNGTFGTISMTSNPAVLSVPDAAPELVLLSTPSNVPATLFYGASRFVELAALPTSGDGTLAYLAAGVVSGGSIQGLYFNKSGSWVLVA